MSELFRPGDQVKVIGLSNANSKSVFDRVGTVLSVGRHYSDGKVWVEFNRTGVVLIRESDLSHEPAPEQVRLNAGRAGIAGRARGNLG